MAKATAWPAEKRLVLGIGTGRSGSESLAALLALQDDTSVSHEFAFFCAEGHRANRYRAPLQWRASEAEIDRTIADLARYPGAVVGDVASAWLPHLERVRRLVPDVRIIAIERPRAEVVQSFLRKTEGRNHWIEHDGTLWRRDALWDPVFPDYPVSEKEEALGRYWDEYYETCAALEARWKSQFRVWPLASLNSATGRSQILAFAGFEAGTARLAEALHRNVGRAPGGSLTRLGLSVMRALRPR